MTVLSNFFTCLLISHVTLSQCLRASCIYILILVPIRTNDPPFPHYISSFIHLNCCERANSRKPGAAAFGIHETNTLETTCGWLKVKLINKLFGLWEAMPVSWRSARTLINFVDSSHAVFRETLPPHQTKMSRFM